jgi:hypothetical protein
MTPHQLLLNPSMFSIWIQWVMFQCATRSWWPICVIPCCVLTAAGKSLAAGLEQNQVQTDGVTSHDTSSVASEPFHVLHMDPMSDVSMCILIHDWLCAVYLATNVVQSVCHRIYPLADKCEMILPCA